MKYEHSTDCLQPTFIDRICVTADLPRGAGKKIQGLATAERKGFREISGSLTMSDPSWNKPCISVTGFSCTELGRLGNSSDLDEGASSIRKICAEIVYREDVDLLLQQEAQELFGKDLEDPVELESFTASAQKATAIFINKALKGLSPEIEASLPTHLVKYVEWMRHKQSLAQQGALDYQDGTDAWLRMGAASEDSFLTDFKDTQVVAKMMCAIGYNFTRILDGSIPPLTLMLKDDMLSKSYTEAHGLRTGLQMIKDWFDLKGHKQPDMKILEIGAGTGSITLPILQALGGNSGNTARFDSYVFTDISAGFFEKAAELLKDWQGFVEFKKLDIEKDPVEQGFELGSFDVIAASNVSQWNLRRKPSEDLLPALSRVEISTN